MQCYVEFCEIVQHYNEIFQSFYVGSVTVVQKVFFKNIMRNEN